MVVCVLHRHRGGHGYLCLRRAVYLADSIVYADLPAELRGHQSFLAADCAESEFDAVYLVKLVGACGGDNFLVGIAGIGKEYSLIWRV